MIANRKNIHEGLVDSSVRRVITAANATSRIVQITRSSEAVMPRRISTNVVRLYTRCTVRTANEDSSMKNHPPFTGSMYHDASASSDSITRATAMFRSKLLKSAAFIIIYSVPYIG